ncbi:MAG: hypothetical protein M1826_005339 [Phylliscum demangeonii]|nr:MAG: hypothetical protein M1826_005339 [Phylliscum demangeonii]
MSGHWKETIRSPLASMAATQPPPPPPPPMAPHHPALPSVHDLVQGVMASGRGEDGGFSPRDEPMRDSGNWSMPSQSKHSSTASFMSNGLQLPALSTSRNSPGDRRSGPSGPPTESLPHHGTFLHGPDEPTPPPLPRLTRAFDPPPPVDRREPSERTTSPPAPPSHVRPNSVNSRMHHLALNSPVASANASQTSLVSGLQRERGILADATSAGPPPHAFRYSAPQAAVTTTSLGRRVVGRTAPPIGDAHGPAAWTNPNADLPTKGVPWAFPDPDGVGPNPNAMKPTKGLPWAFPDPELAARPSSKSDHDGAGSRTASVRRDSIGAASVTSSLYTTDSRMPPGQRRFEDELGSPTDLSRPVSFSHDVGPGAMDGAGLDAHHHHHHHHHPLQHRQASGLSDGAASVAGNTPYSRTPELRVSHKLAERKRRCEMKSLFEELRQILPPDGRMSKSSKWEVLTKAIDYIRSLEQTHGHSERRVDAFRTEATEKCVELQRENHELRDELQRLRLSTSGPAAPSPASASSNAAMHYHANATPGAGPGTGTGPGRPTLPMPSTPSAMAMQGVQYST